MIMRKGETTKEAYGISGFDEGSKKNANIKHKQNSQNSSLKLGPPGLFQYIFMLFIYS